MRRQCKEAGPATERPAYISYHKKVPLLAPWNHRDGAAPKGGERT